MLETVNAARETKRNFLRTLGETEKLTRLSMATDRAWWQRESWRWRERVLEIPDIWSKT